LAILLTGKKCHSHYAAVLAAVCQICGRLPQFAAGCRNLRQAAAICGRLPQFAAGMRNLPQIASTCRKLLRDK
jgi:hypothetical protein